LRKITAVDDGRGLWRALLGNVTGQAQLEA
jgi:hypothetical protein